MIRRPRALPPRTDTMTGTSRTAAALLVAGLVTACGAGAQRAWTPRELTHGPNASRKVKVASG